MRGSSLWATNPCDLCFRDTLLDRRLESDCTSRAAASASPAWSLSRSPLRCQSRRSHGSTAKALSLYSKADEYFAFGGFCGEDVTGRRRTNPQVERKQLTARSGRWTRAGLRDQCFMSGCCRVLLTLTVSEEIRLGRPTLRGPRCTDIVSGSLESSLSPLGGFEGKLAGSPDRPGAASPHYR